MYHISNDKRTRQSAELIYHGLLDCLNHKSYENITITDLQKATGVARTTFYRSFDNMSDVLFWKCDLCFQEVLNSYIPVKTMDEMDLSRHYFTYWMSHSDILALLIQVNRQDIIYTCHMKNAEILHQHYAGLPDLNSTYGRYHMAVRTGFTISVLTAWLSGGRKETIEELMDIIQMQYDDIAIKRTYHQTSEKMEYPTVQTIEKLSR